MLCQAKREPPRDKTTCVVSEQEQEERRQSKTKTTCQAGSDHPLHTKNKRKKNLLLHFALNAQELRRRFRSSDYWKFGAAELFRDQENAVSKKAWHSRLR